MMVALGAFGCSQDAPLPVPSDQAPALHPPPILRTVTGVVHESAPTEAVTVPSVRIEVVSGDVAGQPIVSDPDGRFQFQAAPSAPLRLRFSAAGYDSREIDASASPDQPIDVALTPTFMLRRQTFEGTFAEWECPNLPRGGSYDCIREIQLPVHHSGAVDVEFCHIQAFDSDRIWLMRDSAVIGQVQCSLPYANGSRPYRDDDWKVEAGVTYTLRIWGDWRQPYRVVITHPN
jgi:hypothetical protein